jgi:hypothetical protein
MGNSPLQKAKRELKNLRDEYIECRYELDHYDFNSCVGRNQSEIQQRMKEINIRHSEVIVAIQNLIAEEELEFKILHSQYNNTDF